MNTLISTTTPIDLFVGQNHTATIIILLCLMAWVMIWKGLALWKAAHRENKWWFIALLVLNTVGILEIIYYFFLDKKDPTENK